MFDLERFLEYNDVPNIEKIKLENRKKINILYFENEEEVDEFTEAIKPYYFDKDKTFFDGLKNRKHPLRMMEIEDGIIRATKSSNMNYYEDCTIWSYQEFKLGFKIGGNSFLDLMIE